MANVDRHPQGVRRDLARDLGQRDARRGAGHPVPPGCGRGRRRSCLRTCVAGPRGEVHRRDQQRRLQVGRRPVRRPELDRAAPLVHVAGVRPSASAGHHREPGGSRPRRLCRGLCDRDVRARLAEGRRIDPNFPRLPLRGRPWSWITGRPRVADGVVVVFNLVAGTLAFLGNYQFAGRYPLAELFVIATSVALWWRRSHPESVALFIVATEAVAAFAFSSREPTGLALVFAMFAVSVWGRESTRRWFAAGAIVLTLAGVALLLIGAFPGTDRFIPTGALSLISWMVGDYFRSRRQFLIDMIERQKK